MELEELEQELRTLRPRRVSLVRELAVERELDADVERRAANVTPLPFAAFARRAFAWGCAAMFLLTLSWLGIQRAGWPAARPGEEEPVLASRENQVVGALDEGVVTLEDGSPARRYRIRSVETLTWTDPGTKASLTWTVPREDVRLVPVSLY